MPGQGLTQGQVAELGFIVRQVGDVGRWRGDVLAEQRRTTQYPRLTGLVRKPGAFWSEHGHRQSPPRPKRTASSTRIQSSGFRACCRTGPRPVDERMLAVEELVDRAVVADDVDKDNGSVPRTSTDAARHQARESPAIDACCAPRTGGSRASCH